MKNFVIELNPRMVDIVLAGLGKLPLEISGEVYAIIRDMCDKQKERLSNSETPSTDI